MNKKHGAASSTSQSRHESVNGFVSGSFRNSCCSFNNSNPEWHGSFSLKQVIFSSSLPSTRILRAHALKEFLIVSDF